MDIEKIIYFLKDFRKKRAQITPRRLIAQSKS